MHNIGIIVADEEVAGAAHIGGELVDFVKPAIDDGVAEIRVAQVADDEIIGLSFSELGKFQVDPTDPEAFMLQAARQMAANKPTSTADQGRPHYRAHRLNARH